MEDSMVHIQGTPEFTDAVIAALTSPMPKNLSTLRSPQIRDHFPFADIRKSQDLALAAIEKGIAKGIKFIIIEAPTGVGKSGICMAGASWAKTLPVADEMTQRGAYILSPQKVLTAQYMSDFGANGLVELKGKSNYWCEKHNTDCDCASVMNNSEEGGDARTTCASCPYRAAKENFIANPNGVTNFAYYLNETTYGGQLQNRRILYIDEAHNIESQILGFADTVISESRAKEVAIDKIPEFGPDDLFEVKTWCQQTFVPKAMAFMATLKDLIEAAKYANPPRKEEHARLAKKLDGYDKFLCRLNRFLNSEEPTNWIAYTARNDTDKRNARGFVEELLIKPLTARLFAHEILFDKAETVVLTSATFLDIPTFMRNLGIKKEDALILQLPSEFPVQNRPIFFWPAGSMSFKKKEQTTPKLLTMIDSLMDFYVGKKGIIHTKSYALNKIIVDHLLSGPHADRIITHTSAPGHRDAAVTEHHDRGDDTVLVSPSMSEGLDLKEDLGRFGIICKVPYAFLDPYTKARMELDSSWYQLLTSLELVQTTGRIVRSRTDKGHNWILDEDFLRFVQMNKRGLPEYWLDSIITKSPDWKPVRKVAA